MKNFGKKVFAGAAAAVLSFGLAVPSVSAAAPTVSLGGDITCYAGQTVTFPIRVSAGNDFESMQARLHYDYDGKRSEDDLSVNSAYSANGRVAVSAKDFADDSDTGNYGYVNLVAYASDPVKDGDLINVTFTVPSESYKSEYKFTLETVIFATYGGGEFKVPEVTKTIAVKEAPPAVKGDSDGDGKVSVRDAAFIAKFFATPASKRLSELPDWADFNGDGKVNVRDAAAIANYLAKKH